MLLHSALRIAALVIVPAMFSVNVDRDTSERPRVGLLEPQAAAPGDVVAAHGVNLERSRVSELVLWSGDNKAITHILEQRADLIRFRVPMMMEPGDYRIVLVADTRWGTEMINQDVVLKVVAVYRSAL